MAPFAPLGAALRTLRQRSRQTQRQLSRATGLSAGVISRYERGLEQPGSRALERLLAELGSDLEALHQTLCAQRPPVLDLGTSKARLAAIERTTGELKRLLDELAGGTAVLAGLAPAVRTGTPPVAAIEPAARPRGPLVLEHLHQSGRLDRWAIEPESSEQEPTLEAEPGRGERLSGRGSYAERLARVEQALQRLRERVSFYQRFS